MAEKAKARAWKTRGKKYSRMAWIPQREAREGQQDENAQVNVGEGEDDDAVEVPSDALQVAIAATAAPATSTTNNEALGDFESFGDFNGGGAVNNQENGSASTDFGFGDSWGDFGMSSTPSVQPQGAFDNPLASAFEGPPADSLIPSFDAFSSSASSKHDHLASKGDIWDDASWSSPSFNADSATASNGVAATSSFSPSEKTNNDAFELQEARRELELFKKEVQV